MRACSVSLLQKNISSSSINPIDPFHGQIYGRARKRFNARNHAPWWDCSDLEAACKSECFRELDRIAKTRYLEKLKLLGLDKTDDSFQLFVTRSNRSGKLIIGADSCNQWSLSKQRERRLPFAATYSPLIMARVQGSFLPNTHAYSSRVTSHGENCLQSQIEHIVYHTTEHDRFVKAAHTCKTLSMFATVVSVLCFNSDIGSGPFKIRYLLLRRCNMYSNS